MLLHYAGLDKRINAGIPGYKAALEAAGVDHTIHMYEGANHAFHNDTSATRYHKESAELAWSRTIDFLKESLA
jgi:carboxymethylenebutenolidase